MGVALVWLRVPSGGRDWLCPVPGLCSGSWGRQGWAKLLALAGWPRWTQIKLVNLSRPRAGRRQGAAGRLLGVPLIVTMTLTPDVAQRCPELAAE